MSVCRAIFIMTGAQVKIPNTDSPTSNKKLTETFQVNYKSKERKFVKENYVFVKDNLFN